jgi:transcriptional regulator with XRE-family HTH domain
MENILMIFCRMQKRYGLKTIAAKLGISVEMYIDIEKGNVLITQQQARELGKLYNADSSYFYNEALQLDLLHTRSALLNVLKMENDLLKLEVGDHAVPA